MRYLGRLLIAFVFCVFDMSLTAQQAQILAPHKPVVPKVTSPRPSPVTPILRSLVGGFWMVGPDLKASILLGNDVVTSSIVVTPILHLSSGQSVTLSKVKLDPSGIGVVSINDGLIAANVALSKPLYGYLEVQYSWAWDAICASIKDIDVAHSLIFIYTLAPLIKPARHTPIPSVALMQDNILEGFWWKQEPGVTGFIALSNVLEKASNARIVVSDESNDPVASHSITVPGHGTALLNLSEIESATAAQGGIRITYDGPTDGLEINGGLQDPAVGYSAHLPLHFPPVTSAQNATLSYAALDLMSGAADPNMSFPAGTTFTPYSVVRNISNQPLTLTPTLWWMAGMVPHSARLSPVSIPPYHTVNLNAPALLAEGGPKGFTGSFNLVLDADGQSRALLEVAGSVDQTENYVFEVSPMAKMESVAKTLSYWSTGNGDNTMVTLWNPADEPQSLSFVLYFAGGDGQYTFPIYLNGRETRSFNITTILNNSAADAEGHVIPPGTHEGRAEIMGANGENEHILVAIDEGVYNVQKATCANQYCKTCQGAVSSWVSPDPSSVAQGSSIKATFTVQYKSGTQYDHTSVAAWTSSNTSVATVSGGTVTGTGAGNAILDASDGGVSDYSYNCYSSNPDMVCPVDSGQEGSAPVTGQVPTSIPAVGSTVNQAGLSCPAGQHGWNRVAVRQLEDQSGSPIKIVTLISELVATVTNGLLLPPPTTANGDTNLNGQIGDNFDFCSTQCPSGNSSTYSQTMTNIDFPLGIYSIVKLCTGVTVDGK